MLAYAAGGPGLARLRRRERTRISIPANVTQDRALRLRRIVRSVPPRKASRTSQGPLHCGATVMKPIASFETGTGDPDPLQARQPSWNGIWRLITKPAGTIP